MRGLPSCRECGHSASTLLPGCWGQLHSEPSSHHLEECSWRWTLMQPLDLRCRGHVCNFGVTPRPSTAISEPRWHVSFCQLGDVTLNVKWTECGAPPSAPTGPANVVINRLRSWTRRPALKTISDLCKTSMGKGVSG